MHTQYFIMTPSSPHTQVYRWWPMFFVGSFVGEQVKTLQARLKECKTNPTDATGLHEETKHDIVSNHDDAISNATLDADKSDHDKNQVDFSVA